jgi:hypothetical protein
MNAMIGSILAEQEVNGSCQGSGFLDGSYCPDEEDNSTASATALAELI